jgi:hypothetical protein
MPEALEKIGISIDLCANFGQGLPLSHFPQQCALMLIKPRWILMISTPAYQRQPETDTRVCLPVFC